MSDLPASADLVVVGGGAIGASALYYATRLGAQAVLIERETLGSGSTSAAAGGFRVQFSDELNIRISLESIRRLERFGEEPGAHLDLKQWGYLFLLNDAELPEFEASVRLQQSIGAPSRVLTPSEAKAIVPGLDLTDIAGATYCPIDGYVTPMEVVDGYADAARRAGARIVQGCAARALLTDAGRVVGVDTERGRIATSAVILAAGIWSPALAEPVGLQLPVKPERRHVFFTEPGDDLPYELPLTIDFQSGFYFHREGDGLLFGGRQEHLDELAPFAVRRLPQLAELGIRSGWSGFYEMTPDHNAVVGAAESPAGVVYATGFSGHGFQQAPVIGEHLADLALGRRPWLDLSSLSAARFRPGGRPRAEVNVV